VSNYIDYASTGGTIHANVSRSTASDKVLRASRRERCPVSIASNDCCTAFIELPNTRAVELEIVHHAWLEVIVSIARNRVTDFL